MGEPPVGFRFYPTEEELLSFYLPAKLHGIRQDIRRVIPDVNVFDIEPWDLPNLAGEFCQGEVEQWFFFVPMQEREARGGRPSRTTASGYWKATGSPGYVFSLRGVIGLKKTMVFYTGRAPTGSKTIWKMNEYRAIERGSDASSSTSAPKLRHEFCLCRLYITSGSSRAFDRRPPEISIAREARVMAGVAATSHADMTARASYSEASFPGGDPVDVEVSFPGGDPVDVSDYNQQANWGMTGDLEQLLRDWEY